MQNVFMIKFKKILNLISAKQFNFKINYANTCHPLQEDQQHTAQHRWHWRRHGRCVLISFKNEFSSISSFERRTKSENLNCRHFRAKTKILPKSKKLRHEKPKENASKSAPDPVRWTTEPAEGSAPPSEGVRPAMPAPPNGISRRLMRRGPSRSKFIPAVLIHTLRYIFKMSSIISGHDWINLWNKSKKYFNNFICSV